MGGEVKRGRSREVGNNARGEGERKKRSWTEREREGGKYKVREGGTGEKCKFKDRHTETEREQGQRNVSWSSCSGHLCPVHAVTRAFTGNEREMVVWSRPLNLYDCQVPTALVTHQSGWPDYRIASTTTTHKQTPHNHTHLWELAR